MENELRRIVDSVPALIWSADREGSVEFVNQQWCDYTGLSAAEAHGQGWQLSIHPEDRPEVLARWQLGLRTGKPNEIEARIRRADGVYRWFLTRAVPSLDDTGNVIRWHGFNVDIDDQVGERERSRTSLSQALDGLKKSEAQLRAIIDTIPTIAWCSLADGSGEFWNQRWQDYTGVVPQDALGWGWETVVHPDDVESLTSTWRSHLEAGTAGEVEGRLRRFDGEYRWFLFRFEPLRDESGTIVNWYGTNTDIEDRKRAETLLGGEKEIFEMVASGRPLLEVLDALCRLFDATAEGCRSGIILLDNTRTKVQHAMAPGLLPAYSDCLIGLTVTSEAGPCGMAMVQRRQIIVSDITADSRWDRDGWPALATAHGLRSCWSSPILSLNGESLGSFGIYQARTGTPTDFHQSLIQKLTHIASIAIERTRSEEALKRSEAFLAQAQHVSSTGGFFWYPETDEITWSEEVYRIFELDQTEPVTLDLILTRVHPDDIPAFEEMLFRQKRDGGDFEHDYRLLMPDKSIKYLQVVAHATRDENDRMKYIAAVQDVTQRRLSEETLSKVRSELAHVARIKSLGAMTASIAHEVNQPLSGIITNASTCLRMLAADPPNVDGARETARRTIRDGNRASDVITRLRALFEKKDAATDLVDLNEATREVIALSLSELQRGRVILRSELADDLPRVRGDRVQLQQVILNLMRNAIDAMSGVNDRPRYLMIGTALDENDCVRLSVQDTGVGLELESTDRLFEAFYTTKNGGMGIGLSVSRSIIESHHGHLSAAENDGPGATFSFSIPCCPEGAASGGEVVVIRRPAAKGAA